MNTTVEEITLEAPAPERGHAMTTFLGTEFWPLDPRVEDMHEVDVAHHLAMQVRFNGAIKEFYSVAEHCVIGSYLVPPELALDFLMHDRAETWLGDMIRPVKNGTICGDEYKKIEDRIDHVSAPKWNLIYPTPSLVKRVDSEMCVIEQRNRYFMTPDCLHIDTDLHPNVQLHFWSWRVAKRMFLRRFGELSLAQARRLARPNCTICYGRGRNYVQGNISNCPCTQRRAR